MAVGVGSTTDVGTWTGTTVGTGNGWTLVSVATLEEGRYRAWDGYQQRSRHSMRELCSSLAQGKKERLH
jgi:hypothetical protein